jgi:dihydrolipoamide dehydrogenase
MLVIGGGIIGLEMATVYSTLGARVDVVEMLDGLMQGPDRDLVKVWEKKNARFDKVMLKTRVTVAVDALPDGLWVTFEGEQAPAEAQRYDMILQSAAAAQWQQDRADKAGVAVNERGFIAGRQPDAHQCAAHLRHRRHRRPAHAGAQGGA